MSAPKFSPEVLRGLNRDQVIARIARYETEAEVQQEVVHRLDSLLDTEQRALWDTERALNEHRDVLVQIDALRGRAMTTIEVTVLGDPVGQGNIRHLGKGRPAVHQNAKTLKPWREQIGWQVRQEMALQGVDLIPKDQPVELHATFTVARPASVPVTARWAPVVRPDLDHYLRALCDSLSGVLLEDDSQIVTVAVSKVYAHGASIPGVTFTVAPAERGEAVAA